MFSVHGDIGGGESRTVTWDDGELGGDADAVALVLDQIGRTVLPTPTGPSVIGGISEPLIAVQTIGSIFRSYAVSGDAPEPPEPAPDRRSGL
jgi:hypothetical protein